MLRSTNSEETQSEGSSCYCPKPFAGCRGQRRLARDFSAPPHQFFSAHQIEENMGYVWYCSEHDLSFAFGVRQSEHVWVTEVIEK